VRSSEHRSCHARAEAGLVMSEVAPTLVVSSNKSYLFHSQKNNYAARYRRSNEDFF
jgi:hypothetical protein